MLQKLMPCSLPILVFFHFAVFNAQAQILVDEVTNQVGLNGFSLQTPSVHGLGANWLDYDNDGWPDLFFPDGSGPAHLYHNDGGTFSNADDLIPTLPDVEMTGSVFADYDNDGDQDIYITVGSADLLTADAPGNLLLKNLWVENGNALSTPLFEEVAAAAGVDNLAPVPFGTGGGYQSFTAGWFDYDRDGCVDLFVGTMVWEQGGTDTEANTLYKNNCDGTFTDATVSSGMNPGNSDWLRPTLAFFGGLLNPGDLDPDMYIVNVHDAAPFYEDQIFFGNGDGTFTEVTSTMPGIGDDSGSGMGIDVADVDNDGDWDIYVTDLENPNNEPDGEGNMFYLGNPDGTWNDDTAEEAGLLSTLSWGATFMDLDHDGYEDLYVGNHTDPSSTPSLFHNNHDGTFTDVTSSSGITSKGAGRGTAFADFDRDGDLDFIKVRINKNVQLWENVSANQGNWLQIDLNAMVSNRSAIGTLIEVSAGGLNMMRQVNGGNSAHSQNELVVHFGVGDATNIDAITVSWPSGQVSTLTDVGVNQMITVEEGGNAPPVASFSFVENDLTVDFDGSASSDDSAVVSWDWDFGNGNTGSGSTISHTYAAEGVYEVTLTVTDDEGATGSSTQTVTLGNAPPTAAFTFVTNELMVDFDGSSSSDDVSVVSWDWDFGDGNTATGSTASHTYAAAGTYAVLLTVTDDEGATGSTSQDVTVSEAGTASTMYVESITTVTVKTGGAQGHVEATVTVLDDLGAPVEGATVSGTFSDDASGSDTQVTDANGIAVLSSDNITARPSNIGICVDDVTHASLTYDPAANTDPGFACTGAAPSERSGTRDRLALGLPDKFALHANYPNPFNPTTQISFDLPESVEVQLAVYDLMGRRVATLVQGVVAAGRHEATWDATGMASGIYLYRFSAGSFESLGRMVLMK